MLQLVTAPCAVFGQNPGIDQTASDPTLDYISATHINDRETGHLSTELNGDKRGDEYTHRMWSSAENKPAGITTGQDPLTVASPVELDLNTPPITAGDGSTVT